MSGPNIRRRKAGGEESPTSEEIPVAAAPAEAAAPAPAAPAAPAVAPEADEPKGDKQGRRKRLQQHQAPPRPVVKESQGSTASPMTGRLSELEAIANMDNVDMESLLGGQPMGTRMPEPGEKLTGTVIRISGDEAQVDLGLRAEGFLPLKDMGEIVEGQTIQAFVVWADDTGIQLSKRLSGDAAASLLEDAVDSGIPVEGVVRSSNPGGYEVRVGGVRCFCPGSMISRLPLEDRDSVLGQTLTFRVIETGDKIVLSRKALQQEELEESRKAFLAQVAEGQTYEATVLHVAHWGAYLDIQGAEVRLTKREFSWDEVDDLTAHLTRGATIMVRISNIDIESDRINVSRRDPDLDPWTRVHEHFTVLSVYTGKVVSQTDFGVFVQLKAGLQGLVHTSRLTGPMPAPGSEFEVRLLSIDLERRRLELAPKDFDPAAQSAHGVGSTVKGEIIEVSPGGVAVKLEDGRRAWLPSREVELPAGTVIAQKFRAGHSLEGRIVNVRGDKVTLSQKADDTAEKNAWRSQLKASTARGGMGTLGDLLGGWKK